MTQTHKVQGNEKNAYTIQLMSMQNIFDTNDKELCVKQHNLQIILFQHDYWIVYWDCNLNKVRYSVNLM